MTGIKAVVVPKELYYHEVSYVSGLEARIKAAEKRVAELEEPLRKVRSWLAEEEKAHAIELAFIDAALEAKS